MSYFRISLPLIECKQGLQKGLGSNCQLKQFLDSGKSVYTAWPYENRLLPDTNDFQAAFNEIEKIKNICKNCKINGR